MRRSGGASAGPRPGHWAERLPAAGVPNLHRVAPGLLRSAQPGPQDVDALQALGVRTLVSFRAFSADEARLAGAPFALRRVPINTWHIRDRHVVRALGAILAAEREGAVLVHCMHGADRTGLVCALYRMAVQGWSRDEARREMLHGGFGYHTMWRNIPRFLAGVDAAAIGAAVRAA
jgi:protein tyrosine/serine phosphatase